MFLVQNMRIALTEFFINWSLLNGFWATLTLWLKSANSRIENILLNVFGRSLDRDDGGVLPAGHLHLVREKKKKAAN